jgi:hypothetical protein
MHSGQTPVTDTLNGSGKNVLIVDVETSGCRR